jgi:Kef-type K+ transport system membrane component KefB
MAAFLAQSPLATFALLLAISVLVPPLIRRLGLPDLVGLLLAGVLIGPHALGWLQENSPTVRLLADVGVIYLLFIAGLEIDLAQFQRIRARSLRFGVLTFSLPMLAGALLALPFGYAPLSAVLIGSILASHTPLGYPIVRSYGAVREESVTVAIGGTIFTDIAALLVLALCMGVGRGDLTATSVALLLFKVAVYGALVVLLITRFGRVLVQRSVNSDSQLFVAVLLALFVAALGAGLAGVEKIVGAFLAGLAVNAVLPEGRVKEQVVFVGATLFIPVFFIDLGLLLDVPVFASTILGSAFALALIATLISSKGLASWWAGRLYGYNDAQVLTLWSLSLPQVAATLAHVRGFSRRPARCAHAQQRAGNDGGHRQPGPLVDRCGNAPSGGGGGDPGGPQRRQHGPAGPGAPFVAGAGADCQPRVVAGVDDPGGTGLRWRAGGQRTAAAVGGGVAPPGAGGWRG